MAEMKKSCVALIVLWFMMSQTAFCEEVPNDTDNVDDIVKSHLTRVVGFSSTLLIPSSKFVYEQNKYTAKAGHGFAAERGNTYIDNLFGRNSSVVGDDNALNGPDRRIISRSGQRTWIQTKYCQSAQASVDAAFWDKNYRYMNERTGRPMQLEVPKDQYAEAIRIMEDKIRDGQVPGVKDVSEAKKIVREGHLTYKQSVNLAKAGTIESLVYDASNGIVTGAVGFGIGALLTYGIQRYNGISNEEALKRAAEEGLKTGTAAFAGHVLTAQLIKSRKAKYYAFVPLTKAISKKLGVEFSKGVIQAVDKEILKDVSTGVGIRRSAARILANGAVGAGVTVIVFSIPEMVDYYNGRISKEQFVKNCVVIAAGASGSFAGGIGGAAGGAFLGGPIGAKAGAFVGGIIGGIAGGAIANYGIISFGYEEDAVEMYRIIGEQFAEMGYSYLLKQSDVDFVLKNVQNKFDEDTLKDMYASKNRIQFANNIIEPIMSENLYKQTKIKAPTELEMRMALKNYLSDAVLIN